MSPELIEVLITTLNGENAEMLGQRLRSLFPGKFAIESLSFLKQPQNLDGFDVAVSGALHPELESIVQQLGQERTLVYTNSNPDAERRVQQGYTVTLYDRMDDKAKELGEMIKELGKRTPRG